MIGSESVTNREVAVLLEDLAVRNMQCAMAVSKLADGWHKDVEKRLIKQSGKCAKDARGFRSLCEAEEVEAWERLLS